jgi:hypothetical protein
MGTMFNVEHRKQTVLSNKEKAHRATLISVLFSELRDDVKQDEENKQRIVALREISWLLPFLLSP